MESKLLTLLRDDTVVGVDGEAPAPARNEDLRFVVDLLARPGVVSSSRPPPFSRSFNGKDLAVWLDGASSLPFEVFVGSRVILSIVSRREGRRLGSTFENPALDVGLGVVFRWCCELVGDLSGSKEDSEDDGVWLPPARGPLFRCAPSAGK